MTMQSATDVEHRSGHRYRRTKSQTTVVAARTKSGVVSTFLRAIINRVVVRCRERWNGRMINPAADSFVIDSRRDATALRWHPHSAVVVCERGFAGWR